MSPSASTICRPRRDRPGNFVQAWACVFRYPLAGFLRRGFRHVDPLSTAAIRLNCFVSSAVILKASTFILQFDVPRGSRASARWEVHAHRLCGIRMRSVFQDGRAGGCRWRAAAGAGQSRPQGYRFLPRYKQTKLDNPRTVISSITVPFDDRYRFCSVLDGGEHAGVQFYFIDYPPFFDRDGLYGTPLGDYHDNAERFALFSPRRAGSGQGSGRSRYFPLSRLADRADSRCC